MFVFTKQNVCRIFCQEYFVYYVPVSIQLTLRYNSSIKVRFEMYLQKLYLEAYVHSMLFGFQFCRFIIWYDFVHHSDGQSLVTLASYPGGFVISNLWMWDFADTVEMRSTVNYLRPSDRIYASVNNTIIGSDKGLLPVRRQAMIWTNGGLLLIGPLGTNFIEIWIKIQQYSYKEMNLRNNDHYVFTSVFWL